MRLTYLLLLIFMLSFLTTAQAQSKVKTLTNDEIAPKEEVKPVNKDKYKDVVITLERTGCLAACPIYKLTIYGNGKVVYRGEKNVRVTEERQLTLSYEKVSQLVDAFDKAGYFELKDSYEGGPTDGTTAITSIKINGKKKAIKDYHPAPESPATLVELENKIDNIVNTSQWVDLE